MNQETLAKVWTVVHLFAVYTGINTLLILQNSPALLPLVITIRDEALRGRASMAVIWFFVSAVSLAVSMLLAITYVRRQTAEHGESLAPVLFGLPLDNRLNGLGRFYQVFWLVFCVVICGYGICCGGHAILTAPLYDCDHKTILPDRGGIIEGLMPRREQADIRFDGCASPLENSANPATAVALKSLPDIAQHHGIAYIHNLEDIVVGLLVVLAAGTAVVFWFVWRRKIREHLIVRIAPTSPAEEAKRHVGYRIAGNFLLWCAIAAGLVGAHKVVPEAWARELPSTQGLIEWPLFLAQCAGSVISLAMLMLAPFVKKIGHQFAKLSAAVVDEVVALWLNFASIWFVTSFVPPQPLAQLLHLSCAVAMYILVFLLLRRQEIENKNNGGEQTATENSGQNRKSDSNGDEFDPTPGPS